MNYSDKDSLITSLFSLLITATLLAAQASNYSNFSLFIKLVCSATLLPFLYYYFKKRNKMPQIEYRPFILLCTFIIYTLASLTWSADARFGLLKLAHLSAGNFVPALSFYIMLTHFNSKQEKIFFAVVLLISLTAGFASFLLSPFNPFIPYSFSPGRWSHVVFGRFIYAATLIPFYLLAQSESIYKRGLYFFLALLLVAAAAFSGYRTGIVAFFFTSLIWLLLMRTLSIQTVRTLLLLFILIASGLVLASIISPGNFERFADLRGLITGEKIDDGSFNARLEAYKSAAGLFTGSPLTGAGLGSFKSTPLGSQIKYPHNILLEFAAELGIIGILFFLIFIYSATNRLIKSKSPWLLLFAYSFILSLFSKDIASNSFLFIFLSLTLIKNDSIVYK